MNTIPLFNIVVSIILTLLFVFEPFSMEYYGVFPFLENDLYDPTRYISFIFLSITYLLLGSVSHWFWLKQNNYDKTILSGLTAWGIVALSSFPLFFWFFLGFFSDYVPSEQVSRGIVIFNPPLMASIGFLLVWFFKYRSYSK